MTDNTERNPMSTLTDLIAEALGCDMGHEGADPVVHFCETHEQEWDDAGTCPTARKAAAVVADWLESTDTIRAAEDAHPERGGSCCFNMGQPGHRCPPYVTSASMSAALAAEAQKGARRD